MKKYLFNIVHTNESFVKSLLSKQWETFSGEWYVANSLVQKHLNDVVTQDMGLLSGHKSLTQITSYKPATQHAAMKRCASLYFLKYSRIRKV
jgi:hypothetical protein